MISDFLTEGFDDELKIANKKHDLVALQIVDERESEIPNVGMIQLQDAETGIIQWFDTSSAKNRTAYKANALKKTRRNTGFNEKKWCRPYQNSYPPILYSTVNDSL